MSSWGLTDNAAITGTVTTYTTNTTVTGSGSTFTTDVDAGDYLAIDGVDYQIATVTSDTVLTLTNVGAANASGKTAYVQTGPKYVQNVVSTGNTYSVASIYGVDAEEAGVTENRERNLKVPGWTNYTTYTDALGQTRHKAEALVALSKNFNAASIGDADDDAVVADFRIFFSTQPSDNTVAANAAVTFTAVESSDPSGATITFQWQESPNNIVFANLSDAGVYTGTTSNTLVISDSTGLQDYYYKLVISGDGGADINTSAVAQILFA